ncbi:MAG: hypothetical protein ACHREM_03760 [Polyangiales bacterium]
MAFAVALVAAAVFIAALLLPRDPGPVEPALAQEFPPFLVHLLVPEPSERLLFVGAVIALPIVSWAAIALAQHWRSRARSRAAAACVFGFALATGALLLQPGVLSSRFGSWLPEPAYGVSIILLGTAAWAAMAHLPARSAFILTPRLLAVALACCGFGASLWKVFRAQHVYDSLEFSYHFGAVLYPISQSVAGRVPLVDFPTQYGFFGEILAPVFRLCGLSVLSVTLLMVALQSASTWALLLSASRIVQSRVLLVSFGAALLYVPQNAPAVLGSQDPYFQYWPIRTIFPALALGAVLRWSRAPTVLHACLMALICGVGMVWNADSGVAVLGAWLGYLFLHGVAAWRHDEARFWLSVRTFALSVAIVATIGGLFFLYLSAAAHQWIDVRGTLTYSRVFYLAGFNMMPMPTTPHLWQVVAALYIAAFCLGLRALRATPCAHGTDPMFFTSMMGIGLFAYYQGRSHDLVLGAVLWPALLVAYWLVDRLWERVRAGQVSMLAASPAFVMSAGFGLMCLVGVIAMLPASVGQLRANLRAPASIITENIAFIRASVGADRECAILANHQAVYFAETGLASALQGPDISELVLRAQLDQLNRQLDAARPRHLIIEQRFMPGSRDNPFGEGLARLDEKYSLVARSASGTLAHFVRREHPL